MTTHYEMLWDCSSCGTTKLLGKTHRRCPNCGAPQDPAKRYFPKPGEEVEAAGHQFVGADWLCAACTTPNSKAASFCGNCGNPRDEGNQDAARVVDRIVKDGAVVPPPGAAPAPAPRRSRLWLVAGAVAALVVAAILVAVFWQRSDAVRVERHRWTRDIDVEQLAPRADSSWCDQTPGGAYNVRHQREQRSTRQVPDGQDCHQRNVDNGDGTFHSKTECTTRYRSEPVYDDRCYYTVDRWGLARRAHAEGAGLSPGPSWPAVMLARAGNCLGCEREGARRQQLLLDLVDGKRKRFACDVDENRWRRFADGAAATVKVRVVTGGAVCSSLR